MNAGDRFDFLNNASVRRQFSLRTSLIAIAIISVLLALPKWFGPGIAGYIVAVVVSPFIVFRFKTPGFLVGVLFAWISFSLGSQFQWLRDDVHTAGATIGSELAGIWLGGLLGAFVYLVPIYLARVFWDYSRLRARLGQLRVRRRREAKSRMNSIRTTPRAASVPFSIRKSRE